MALVTAPQCGWLAIRRRHSVRVRFVCGAIRGPCGVGIPLAAPPGVAASGIRIAISHETPSRNAQITFAGVAETTSGDLEALLRPAGVR